MFKLDLEMTEEPEIKLPTSTGSLKKQESSRKASTSTLLTIPKFLTRRITTYCGKFSKRWEYHSTLHASWEICIQVRKQQLELDIEQTGSKLGKSTSRLYVVTLLIYLICRVHHEKLGWMKHKLDSRLEVEISITSDMQMTPPLLQKAKN